MIRADLNQSRLRGGQRLPMRRVEEVLRACSRFLKLKRPHTISIGFVSAPQMRELNRKWRGKDRVTDVLSFGAGPGDYAGEVVLNYEQAQRQAKEFGHSTRDELLFLVTHGVLHLFGYDHETPKDAKRMFPLQRRILDALHIDSRL